MYASVCVGQKYPVGQGPEPSGVLDPRGQKKPSKQRWGVEKFLGTGTVAATPVLQ
jgi:hypothetical protein